MKPEDNKTLKRTPEVEDPHPGSISDGTHPAAREHSQPKPTNRTGHSGRFSSNASKPTPNEGQTAVNS